MHQQKKDQLYYLLLKLHSLTGIIPIGVFLVFHLAFNALRTVGVTQYQIGIDLINNAPFLIWIEIFAIYIPLLFHSIMGFYVTYMGENNVFRYKYARNWMYTLQRVTGAIVFAFLIYHLLTTVVPKMVNGKTLFDAAPFLINIMNEEFKSLEGQIIYLVGITATTFHFANGLWGFCVSWGILIGNTAQKNAAILFMIIGLVLTVMGLATVLEFSLHPLSSTKTLI